MSFVSFGKFLRQDIRILIFHNVVEFDWFFHAQQPSCHQGFITTTARTRRFINNADLHAGDHLQAEGSEAKGQQDPIHTATHPAKVGNAVFEELEAEIEDDDSWLAKSYEITDI